ncbi:hypothetical protein IMSAG013_01139 [Clostridiales bacterium]|nr:hypothetical protein IMSAG013_01139 [Clostridiales bacterium]
MPKYIDAEKLIKNHFSDECNIALSYANKCWMRKIINDEPAADVKEVVHGKWMRNGMDLVCTACGSLALTYCYDYIHYRSLYCPSCGAKMDGGKTT